MSDRVPDQPITEDDASEQCICGRPLDHAGLCTEHGNPEEYVAEERADRKLNERIQRGEL